MRIPALFAALSLAAGPVLADPLGLNDYPKLFEAHADRVHKKASGNLGLLLDRQLAIVGEDYGYKYVYTGTDVSRTGGLGCYVDDLAHLTAFTHLCPTALEADQMMRLDDYTGQALTAYGAGTFPTADLARTTKEFDALVARLQPPLAAVLECETDRFYASIANEILREGMEPVFNHLIAQPRLPVSKPCNW